LLERSTYREEVQRGIKQVFLDTPCLFLEVMETSSTSHRINFAPVLKSKDAELLCLWLQGKIQIVERKSSVLSFCETVEGLFVLKSNLG
jgi:hypothetical protein